jgi:hypothetical protein
MIILSCGHEVDDFAHSHTVMIKETNDYGGKAIGYMMICDACEEKYRHVGAIFDE